MRSICWASPGSLNDSSISRIASEITLSRKSKRFRNSLSTSRLSGRDRKSPRSRLSSRGQPFRNCARARAREACALSFVKIKPFASRKASPSLGFSLKRRAPSSKFRLLAFADCSRAGSTPPAVLDATAASSNLLYSAFTNSRRVSRHTYCECSGVCELGLLG